MEMTSASKLIASYKREAKAYKNANGGKHAAALNAVAAKHGYENWSTLKNKVLPEEEGLCQVPLTLTSQAGLAPEKVSQLIDIARPHEVRPIRVPLPADNLRHVGEVTAQPAPPISFKDDNNRLVFIRKTEDMKIAIKNSGAAFSPAVVNLSKRFADVENAFDFAIAYMETLLSVPRLSVPSKSQVESEIDTWLPYCVRPVLGNRFITTNRLHVPVGFNASKCTTFFDYEHLFIYISDETLKLNEIPEDVALSLYDFDSPPWTSRKHAKDYLMQLKDFREYARTDEARIEDFWA